MDLGELLHTPQNWNLTIRCSLVPYSFFLVGDYTFTGDNISVFCHDNDNSSFQKFRLIKNKTLKNIHHNVEICIYVNSYLEDINKVLFWAREDFEETVWLVKRELPEISSYISIHHLIIMSKELPLSEDKDVTFQ